MSRQSAGAVAGIARGCDLPTQLHRQAVGGRVSDLGVLLWKLSRLGAVATQAGHTGNRRHEHRHEHDQADDDDYAQQPPDQGRRPQNEVANRANKCPTYGPHGLILCGYL